MALSTQKCLFCENESDLYFHTKDYNRQTTQEIFTHYRCRSCKLIFIAPIPTDLGEYYPQEYYYIPETVDFFDIATPPEKYKIEIIKQFVSEGRLLEIGPSLGAFSYLAKQSGFDVEAIEMDTKCSEFLNSIAGIPTVNNSDTCDALKSLNPFDVVAMWHVIEHLPDPLTTLEAIADKVNPRGILILAAPNPGAFQFHVMGRYWPHVDAPRHLMLIPPQLLVDKLKGLGMSVELITTNDEGGLNWNIFGWEYFIYNICRSLNIKRKFPWIGRTLAKLVSVLDKKEGKGSTYTMVFRKEG